MLTSLFSIDPRTLALFRLSIASLLLVDLADRARDLWGMYTDLGVAPIDLVKQLHTTTWSWSFHFFHGSFLYQSGLFLLAACFATALLVGYQTRIATIVSWLLLVSLHTRMPLVLCGGDELLRMLLFWGMFLPWGQHWSLDAARHGPRSNVTQPIVSAASAGLLLQVCFMYWFTGLLKWNESWLSGMAVYHALATDVFATPLGRRLIVFPDLLRCLTYLTLALELIGPFLLFIPWHNSRWRIVTIVVFLTFHVALYLTLAVGLFSVICMVSWIVFLPARFWSYPVVCGVLRRVEFLYAKQDSFGKFSAGSLTASHPEQPSQHSRVTNVVAGFFLVYVLCWNINTLSPNFSGFMPPSTRWLGQIGSLQQWWYMFANPITQDGWYVAQARLQDGEIVDLLQNGRPVAWRMPEKLGQMHSNGRWTKLFFELTKEYNRPFCQPLANYLANHWNQGHPAHQHIEELNLMFCENLSGPLGQETTFMVHPLAQVMARSTERSFTTQPNMSSTKGS